MLNTEQVIVACASCGTQYNVSTMAPGAKFKCQKCATINIVPAAEEPVQEQAPPQPRIQARPQVKTSLKPVATPPRQTTSRVPPSLKKGLASKGKLTTRTYPEGDDENTGIGAKNTGALGGLLDPKNRKYLLIGGAVLLVLISAFYAMHSRSVYEKNKQIGEKATEAIKEINGLTTTKDYTKALEKSEAFVKEFKEYEIPEVKKNVEKTEISIKSLEKLIELEKEGKAKLAGLIDKKNDAAPDQYDEVEKEFNKFMTKYSDISALVSKAHEELKDIQAKIAAKQEEDDTKIYNALMAEIKPMVDGGKIDAAIAHLKKYRDDTPKVSTRIKSALKKKLAELKEMK